MTKKATPTAAELEILTILWNKEPLTVKEVHTELAAKKDIGYTTALKIMQNMTSKGLLNRELKGKSHLYSAAFHQQVTQQNLLNKFVDTTFGGSASRLIVQLLGNGKTSKEELKQIKKIIADMENE